MGHTGQSTEAETERENFRNLFRQTPEMVCILGGPEHRFEFVNEAHIRALGKDVTGQTLREAQPESVEVHGILDQVYRTGVTAKLREIAVTVGERLRYFNLTYAARKNSHGEINGVMILGSEVTEAVLARRVTEDQQKWLEEILDQLPIALVLIDPQNTQITFSNKTAQGLFDIPLEGTQPHERMGQNKVVVYDSNGRPLSNDQIPSARAARGEELRHEEFSLQTPQGPRKIAAFSCMIPESFGHQKTALLLLQDITAMRSTQTALERSEEQLSLALDTSKVGFYDWNISEDRIFQSEQMKKDWGITDGRSMSLKESLSFVHKDDLERVTNSLQEALKGRKSHQVDHRIVRPDGEVVWLEISGRITYDVDGKPLRFFGTSKNITKRKEDEEALKKSERQFRLVTDTVPALISYVDRNETYLFANAYYKKWFGIDPQKVIGQTIKDLIGDEPYSQRREAIQLAFAGETQNIIGRSNTSTGEERISSSIYAPDFDEEGNVRGLIILGQDRTQEIRVAEELLIAKEAAEAANSAKSAFLANMSHEIRTPLGAIMGFADLLTHPGLPREEMESYVSVINRNSHQLLRIIDDILDLSKVEAGKMTIERTTFSLPQLLAEFASMISLHARERAIEFEISAATALPDLVISDPIRLRQILTNVVGNAVKFTEKGRVDLMVSFDQDVLEFKVKDTGRGISAEQAQKLFQPFMQADDSTTRRFGGTGLGLVLTKRLCQSMNGDFVLAQSTPGVGSTFTAKVRVNVPSHARLMNEIEIQFSSDGNQKERLPQQRLAGLKVLLVEDSADNQALIRHILSREGVDLDLASDGFQGLQMAAIGHYSVVLMDIQMPRMDGHECTKTLRGRGYQGPIIALTAHAMKEERDRCVASGFSDYLSKPIQKELLIEMLLPYHQNNQTSSSSKTTGL